MERLKRIALRLIFPPLWLYVPVVIPAFALVIYVLSAGNSSTPLAYASYGVSAYALVIVIAGIPKMVRAFRSDFEGQPLIYRAIHSAAGERLLHDAVYRTELSLYAGLAVNLLYVVVKLVCGFVYQSQWFAMVAGYYLLLAVMRFLLLGHVSRKPVGQDMASEWRRYRLCGAALLVMNPALAVIVNRMLSRGDGFVYPGFLVYAMAAYTFYMTALAVVNMIRFRKRGSPVLSAAKAVNLVAAMVSMLALETAMLTQFADAQQERFRNAMITLSGIVVCAAVLTIAVLMIVRSTKRIAAIQSSRSI